MCEHCRCEYDSFATLHLSVMMQRGDSHSKCLKSQFTAHDKVSSVCYIGGCKWVNRGVILDTNQIFVVIYRGFLSLRCRVQPYRGMVMTGASVVYSAESLTKKNTDLFTGSPRQIICVSLSDQVLPILAWESDFMIHIFDLVRAVYNCDSWWREEVEIEPPTLWP